MPNNPPYSLADLDSIVTNWLQDPTYVRWTQAEIERYINDALSDFCNRVQILRRTAHLAPDPNEYPLGAFWVLPSDLLQLKRIEWMGLPLREVDEEHAGANYPTGWIQESGQPNWFLMASWGNADVRLYPYTVSSPAFPTTAPTAGTGASGGPRTYCVTFVDTSGNESFPSPFASTTLCYGAGSGLSAIPTGPSGIASRNIYATSIGSNDGVMFLLGSIADNTTTTFSDTSALSLSTSKMPVCPIVEYERSAPVLASGSTNVPAIPSQYHIALAYYAVAMCFLKKFEYQDAQEASLWMQRYESAIADAERKAARKFTTLQRTIRAYGY